MNHVLMSFLVAGTALGGSALKNVESHTTPLNGRAIAAGYFVQKAANSYTYISTTTHAQGTCFEEATAPCTYRVPAANSIPGDGPYTQSQLESFGLSPEDSANYLWIQQ